MTPRSSIDTKACWLSGMASRGEPSSFNRIFGSGPGPEAADEIPSVHELFLATVRDQMSVQQLAEMLEGYHQIRLTPAAVKILSSVDAASGRLNFAQFQRALADDDGGDTGQAGRANIFQDQAKAIIEDNFGSPAAPPSAQSRKQSTDISADTFIKAQRQIEKGQARTNTFNPVRKTNDASRGNPIAQRLAEQVPEDAVGSAITHTATRMYVSGELDRKGYEKFLRRYGVDVKPESQLHKLICGHEKVGDGKFHEFTKAVQREIGSKPPSPVGSRPESAAGA